MDSPFYHTLFAVFAALLGASIGSFLNVCIYRMPRDLSVHNPSRSFCPKCEYQIPWYRNLPLISWLSLRGKCANCHAPIPFRYFGVELLTALLFLAVWLHVWPREWALAFPYWIFVSLLVVATFIDFEHYIIPDEITWGGAAAGIVLSLAIPQLHGVRDNVMGGVWGLVGAVAGYGLLRAVVELGKLAFGRKKLAYESPQPLRWVRHGQDADLTIGDDKMLWSDFFVRGNEKIVMDATSFAVDGKSVPEGAVHWSLNWLHVGEQKWELEKTDEITCRVSSVVFPREAMGMGDVKFLACIGAFLGWHGAVFSVVAGSIAGAVVGTVALLSRRREWSYKIPFGPYLALGALAWMFFGPALVKWYVGLLMPAQF